MNEAKLYSKLKNELSSYLKPFDEDLLERAYKFAAAAHEGQKRKSGEPYITHPIGAAIILAEMRVDLPTIITCLLHDVPEDTDRTLNDIEKEFGKQIASLVGGITKLSAVYYKHNMQDRQIDTLRRMFLVMAKDIRVVLVKLADRLHNMRTLNHVPPDKAKRIAKETMEIFSPLANLLGVWQIRQEMDDLCFKYVFPDEYKSVKETVEKHREGMKSYVKNVVQKTRELVHNCEGAEVEGRFKHLFSIYKKFKRSNKSSPLAYDLPVVRVVVNSKAECYLVVGTIHEEWKPQPSRFRDSIAVPKPNGYRALHTTVFGPGGQLVEFQIRTVEMDLKGKYGVASEFIFERSDKEADINDFLEKTPWVKKVLKLQTKSNNEFIEDLKLNVLSDRVFVFSPEGDVIDMPYGSSPLDYAYSISRSLGSKYDFATVNKERQPMSYELKTGDIVEIFTDKSNKPERDWLYFVITNEAKDGIKSVFKKRSKKQRVDLGETILDNILFLLGRGQFRNFSKKKKALIAEAFKCENAQVLLLHIGSGDITEQRVSNILQQKQDSLFAVPKLSIKRLYNKVFQVQKYEKIRVRLKLVLQDRVGLLSDIFDVFTHYNVNIIKLTARESLFFVKDKAAIDYIHIEVDDLNRLQRTIRSLEAIDGVLKVTQKKTLELFAFYGSIIAAMLAWLLHPILVSRFTHELFETKTEYLNFFWITSIVTLLIVLYFRRFALSHMPKVVARKRFVIFMNFTVLLIIAMIIGESPLFGYNVQLVVLAPVIFVFMLGGFFYASKQ